jgi:hypothetical protein
MDELSIQERNRLIAWADWTVPEGFADRVVLTRAAERPPELPRRRTAGWVGAAFGLAAVVMISLLTRSAWLDREASRAARHEAAVAEAAPASLQALRRSAQGTLVEYCSPCHRGEHEHAKQDALAVFDLDQATWWETMSDRQLDVTRTRMNGQDDASAQERSGIDAYVEAELAFRAE